MGTNPLDTVKKAYEVSTECFEIAQAVVQKQRANLFTHSSWPTQPHAQQDIDQARLEANDLFVLALWAAFERFVITYLQNKGAILQHLVPNGLAAIVIFIFTCTFCLNQNFQNFRINRMNLLAILLILKFCKF